MINKRKSGILLHITSLPGRFGIGGMGSEAYEFIDFLVETGQKIWQILPTGPTGYGDSPYQTFSAFAGNPLLIDPDDLVSSGLLSKADLAETLTLADQDRIDYGKVVKERSSMLKKAWCNFDPNHDYRRFVENNSSWLDDYSLYRAIKEYFGGSSWLEWDKDIRMAEPASVEEFRSKLHDEIEYHKFQQFLFFRQWDRIKGYASAKSLEILGDLPIFVAMDSSDAWADNELFLFDDERRPRYVAGVPPDFFSATGQLWGNPLYDWNQMQDNGFNWWIRRMRISLEMTDLVRIDHFRGFSGYWAVPFGEKTAVNGQWKSAPGQELFRRLKEEFPSLPIIAEDLGVITDDVIALRDDFHLPGMKILQFAFDSDPGNPFLPHNFSDNCVVYTGTHDNDTITGWYKKLNAETRKFVNEYLKLNSDDICRKLIEAAWSSRAVLAVTTMQDLLGLDSEARINTPATASGNWQWKLRSDQLRSIDRRWLRELTESSDR